MYVLTRDVAGWKLKRIIALQSVKITKKLIYILFFGEIWCGGKLCFSQWNSLAAATS